MKNSIPNRLPEFNSDDEIAAFMEKHNGFDLVDAGLGKIVPTPFFVRKREGKKSILKNQKVQIFFKDDSKLKNIFSSSVSSASIFLVIDTDFTGILLTLKGSKSDRIYIPFLNINGIKIL